MRYGALRKLHLYLHPHLFMIPKFPSYLLACLGILCASAFADIVTLKNGEKVEGKITAETDAEITITVKTGGVIDDQVLKKADVAKVEKEQPDEAAWQPLKNAKLGLNSLPAATAYDSAIGQLTNFATEYPKSAHAAEAKKMAEEFAAEKKRVEAGEVKLDNKWLSKEEAQKEQYQVGALIAFNYMKDQSARDLVGALNTFDAIQKRFPGARAYIDSVEYAQRVLASLAGEVERRKQALKKLKAEREQMFKTLSGPALDELKMVMEREQAGADAAINAAEKQNFKWSPLVNDERTLDQLGSRVSSEIERLRSIPVADMRQSLAIAERAKAAIEKRDFDGADTTIREAMDKWSENEIAKRLQQEAQAARAVAAAVPAEPAPDALAALAPVAAAEPKGEPAPVAEETSVDEVKPFLLTPGGAITVVVALAFVIAGVNAYKKIRGKASDVLE